MKHAETPDTRSELRRPRAQVRAPGVDHTDAQQVGTRTAHPSTLDTFGNQAVLDAMAGSWMEGLGPLIGLHNAFLHAGLEGEALRLTENSRQQELVAIGQDLQTEATAYMARHGQGAPEFSPGVVYELMRRSAPKDLPAEIKSKVAYALGLDPDGIRIHVDGAAAQAAAQINARAFTVGEDIYFARGQWKPGTPEGEHLLLHEATHVKQHREGRLHAPVGGGMQVSSPSDATEVEAERMAAQGTSALQDLPAEALSLEATDLAVGDLSGAEAIQDGATQAAPEAAEAQHGADLVAHRSPGEDESDGKEGIKGDRRKEKEMTDEIDVGAAIEKALAPLEDADAEREDIKQHKEDLKGQKKAAVPSDPPATGTGEDAQNVQEKPSEKVELSLEDPGTVQQAVQEEGVAPVDPKCEFAVTTAVPKVQDAFTAYVGAASAMLIEVSTRGAKVRRDIKTAITTAKGQVAGQVTTLQGNLATRHTELNASIDRAAESAHAKLRELRDKRKTELRTEYDRIHGEVTQNAKTYRGQLQDHGRTKARGIENEGNRIAADVDQYSRDLAAQALVHGDTIAKHWATPANWAAIDNDYEDELASDVGKYARNTSKKAAKKILDAAKDLVEDLKEDGVDLREDMEDHNEDYLEEFDDKVEEIEETWDGGLEAAEARIDQSYEDSKGKIDEAAGESKKELTKVIGGMSKQLGETGTKLLDVFDKGATQADTAIAQSVQDAVDGITAQIEQVKTWVEESHPSQWPEVCETLERLQAEVEADTPSFASKIEAIGQEIVTAVTGGGGQGAEALTKAYEKMEEKLTEFETGVEKKLVDLAIKIDQDVFAERVKTEKADWEKRAKEQDEQLKKTKDDCIVEIDKEFDEGKQNLEEKATDGKEGMREPYDKLKESLEGDCRFMAESPWKARLWNFAKGLGRALLTFLKVLGILVAVVLVIAAIIALCFGWAAVLAVGAAVLGFIAAYATAIAVIAAILTAIGLIMAIIPAIAASLDENVSSFEAWDAWGEFAGNVLVEIAELAVGKMTKAGTFARLFGQADAVVDAVKATDGTLDGADAIADVANAANKTDEFVDIATTADKLSDTVGEMADASKALDSANDATDAIVDSSKAVDQAADTAQTAKDLAKAEDAVDAATDLGKAEDAADAVTDVAKAEDALDATGDLAKTKDAVDSTTDGAKSADALADATEDVGKAAAKTDVVSNADDALAAAQKAGYGGTPEKFAEQFAKGLRFDPSTSRWVRPDNLQVWAEFLEASAGGYGKTFKTFQEQMNAGRHFDLVTSRWVTPDDAAQWAAYLYARSTGFADKFTDFRAASRAGEVWDAASGSFKSASEIVDTTTDAATATAKAGDAATDTTQAADASVDTAKAVDNAGDATTTTTKAADTAGDTASDTVNAADAGDSSTLKPIRLDSGHNLPSPKQIDTGVDKAVDVIADAARIAAEAELAMNRIVASYSSLKGLDAFVQGYYDMLKIINNALTLGPDGEPIPPEGVEEEVEPQYDAAKQNQQQLQNVQKDMGDLEKKSQDGKK